MYENQNALPRAYVVHQIQSGVSDSDAIATLRQPGFPMSVTVLLAATPPAEEVAQAEQASQDDGSTVMVTSTKANEMDLRANMTRAGFVALQDTFYPGWHAVVDVVETPINRNDVNFRAIFVPASAHTIRFIYLPASFVAGVVVMLLPPALLVAWLGAAHALGVWGPSRRRNRNGARRVAAPTISNDREAARPLVWRRVGCYTGRVFCAQARDARGEQRRQGGVRELLWSMWRLSSRG